MAAYALANRRLDALAQRARAQGVPAVSVAWGRWPLGGQMDERLEGWLAELGLEELSPCAAFGVMERAMLCGQTNLTVAAVDCSRFAAIYAARRPRPLAYLHVPWRHLSSVLGCGSSPRPPDAGPGARNVPFRG